MPDRLGRYLLDRKLAQGGMGEVFLARQSGPGGFERLCVVKRMLEVFASDSSFVRMFLDEARIAAQLTHSNIAQIYDFGEIDGTYFLAMEYVEGASLREILRAHAAAGTYLPLAPAARIVSQVASGLDYVHSARGPDGRRLEVIHRDVSPHNILVGRSGAVKLIDFGVAKAASAKQRTQVGMVKGKSSYMSPEQARGDRLDHRSDLYSLGLVLYEALSNRRAIEGDSDLSKMQKAASGEIEPIEKVRHDVPGELRLVLERALAPKPAERYPAAGEMAADLERFLTARGQQVTPKELSALLDEGAGADAAATLPDPDDEPQDRGLAPTRVLSPSARRRPSEARLPAHTLSTTAKRGGRHARALVAIVAGAVAVAAGSAVVFWPGLAWSPEPTTLAEWPLPTETAEAFPAAARAKSSGAERPLGGPPSTSAGSTEPPARPSAAASAEATRREPPPRTSAGAQPKRAAGKLTLLSTPAMSVVVDGVPRGRTPQVLSLPAGEHRVVFEEKGAGLRRERIVSLAEGHDLAEEWRPQKGTVRFRVYPYAEVLLNGRSYGVTPLEPIELYEGRYTFELVNTQEKATATREVDVSPGRETQVKVDFRDKD
ncbi:MAG: serine/threonine protein kinase [Myxococcales bacterium]|nr:serine/threonine protein kinase [Myxococcales bacterium]